MGFQRRCVEKQAVMSRPWLRNLGSSETAGGRLHHHLEDQGHFLLLVGQARFRSYLSRIGRVDKASLLGRARDLEEAEHFHALEEVAHFHALVVAARTVVVVCAVLGSVAFPNKYNVSELRAHRVIDVSEVKFPARKYPWNEGEDEDASSEFVQ
ncbi:hypothetical protein MTO96_001795 [Rhipicephalus appendiculatus]